MSYILGAELGQAILNYLGSQPYAQVAQMVAGMQQLGEIDDAQFGAFMAEQQEKAAAAAGVDAGEPEQDDAED